MKQFLSIAILLLSLCSCEVQKRTFNKGYYVTWNNNYQGSPNRTIKSNKVVYSENTEKNYDKFDSNNENLIKNYKISTLSLLETQKIKRKVSKRLDSEKQITGTKLANLKGLHSMPLIKRHTLLKPKVKNKDDDLKPKVPLHITGITWIDWILEVLICIVASLLGIIASIYTFILLLYEIYSDSKKDLNINNETKTFKNVFLRAFKKSSRIVASVILLVIIIALLLSLAYLIYLEYAPLGWGIILMLLAAVLVVALLRLLFGNWIKRQRFGKDK